MRLEIFLMSIIDKAVLAHAAGTPFQTKLETVSGSGADIELRSLLNRQQFDDPHGEAEALGITSSTWPIFGLLWPSGRVLADVMLTCKIEGRRVLEIGCGLALASLVVHRRGGNITASDCHPLAPAFLAENLRLNHLPVMKYQVGHWSRANPLLARFDLIIGSDLLYDRNQPGALASFIELHAEAAAEILIVDPDRGNRARFSRNMLANGYALTETRITMLPDGSAYKGRLLRFTRAAAPAST